MPLTSFAAKLCLDWLCGGAAATRPSARYVSLATGTPDGANALDGPFTPVRASFVPAAANLPAGTLSGSVTNLSVMSYTPSGGVARTAQGVNLWDAAAAGNRLAYAGIANIGAKSTDTASIPVGSFKLTLN